MSAFPGVLRCALATTLLAATCLATVPARAQPDLVPADPFREEICSVASTFGMGLSPIGGSVLAAYFSNWNMVTQYMLYSIQLDQEDAELTAWTTTQLADMNALLHQSIVGSKALLAKLDEDLDWYVSEFPTFGNPNPVLRSDAEERRYEQYAVLRQWVAAHRPEIETTGDEVLEAFVPFRKGMVLSGGRGAASLKVNVGRLQEALASYTRTMYETQNSLFADLVAKGVLPEQHVRVTLTNTSPNLVFFARVWEEGPGGGYPGPTEDTASWLPIYPQGLGVEVTVDTNRTRQVGLPNELWVSTRPGSRLELRVATMGEHRNRIRFQDLKVTGQMRPDPLAYHRGFYWFGYYVQQASSQAAGGRERKIVSYTFPTSESYQWTFRGFVFDPEPYVPSEAERQGMLENDLHMPRSYASALQLSGDHYLWKLPEFEQDIRRNPQQECRVSGAAQFRRRGPDAGRVTDLPEEAGSGTLLVHVEMW